MLKIEKRTTIPMLYTGQKETLCQRMLIVNQEQGVWRKFRKSSLVNVTQK